MDRYGPELVARRGSDIADCIPSGVDFTFHVRVGRDPGRHKRQWWNCSCGLCNLIILTGDTRDFTIEQAWFSWVQHCLREHWNEDKDLAERLTREAREP